MSRRLIGGLGAAAVAIVAAVAGFSDSGPRAIEPRGQACGTLSTRPNGTAQPISGGDPAGCFATAFATCAPAHLGTVLLGTDRATTFDWETHKTGGRCVAVRTELNGDGRRASGATSTCSHVAVAGDWLAFTGCAAGDWKMPLPTTPSTGP
jgi:hypothetical protein